MKAPAAASRPSGKNIVICCDGTGNEIGRTISNVLKLYRVLEKSKRQRVYYNPGVGTIGQQDAWQRWKHDVSAFAGLAFGRGLDDDVLGAYCFLSRTYEPGDRIWLFGFSRGAYTVRVLAAFLHVTGLLPPDQLNLAGYAFASYKRASAESWARPGKAGAAESEDEPSELEAAWHFSAVAGADPVPVHFIGVWDTVASVIVPRDDRFRLDLQTLRFTRTNKSVRMFRQAIAIDERRRMFRLNRWTEPQVHRPNPYRAASEVPQDIRQVWFAGVHADIGGGYPEEESGLSKFPLQWMIDEAAPEGLHVNRAMVNHLVLGKPRKGSNHVYVPPDPEGRIHQSLKGLWTLLEWLPKKARWREWPARRILLGRYLPRAEPRPIPEDALVHWSVLERMRRVPGYRPPNLPRSPRVEGASPAAPGMARAPGRRRAKGAG